MLEYPVTPKNMLCKLLQHKIFINKLVLISVGDFSDDPREAKLRVNWEKIGIDPHGDILTAPEIEDFQEGQLFKVMDKILIQPRKGYLLYLAGS